MPTSDEIQQQYDRLSTNRETLNHYLQQRDQAGRAYVRPDVTSGIRNARAEIQRIKVTLRSWGEQVDDQPDDEEPPGLALPLPHRGAHGWWAVAAMALLALIVLLIAVLPPWLNPAAVAPLATTLAPISAEPTLVSTQLPPQPTVQLATPTVQPTTLAALAPTQASLSALRVYPNPPADLSYNWYTWREPYALADQLDADATPTVEGSGRSYTRLKYNLAANQFAGLAMTFSAPQDLGAYRFIQVLIGFNRVDERCRLYLKATSPDPNSPTPTPGAANGAGSDRGVMLGLLVRYDAGIDKDDVDQTGVQLVTIPLDDFFPSTDRTRLVEIGLEASDNSVRPVEGRCDLYEVTLLPGLP